MENEAPRVAAMRDLLFHIMRETILRHLDPADATAIADAVAERIALVTGEASDAS